ncbi:prolyl oligopeptidase family serine peptidase [Flammeovirga sp. MY04]|uniref:alpha/beta hydrolase n=1 Tax=Flammeovirga sp. MY04 TaxID=1191459 RepID=UPI0008063D5D|nr:CocE/NonD family hydrolase [Flammeovirga sp. MY04]ANQ48574.1 prolyl oligopeptidase family serine peptidase [Flammeovirga sp. MY04]
MKNIFLCLLTFCILGCNAQKETKTKEQDQVDLMNAKSFKELRTNFKTSLIKEVKAPQYFSEFDTPPENVKVETYESEGLKLKGLLNTKNIDSTKKTKAIVYLHGGFALSYGDLRDCQPFIDAGYIVFAPTYRGENGNDGNFEYFYGEVTDAENAVKWLSQQDYVDADNIFVFGHSIGGGISTLLSLNNNCPSKLNGSCSGLYIKEWLPYLIKRESIPFSISDDNELLVRCPIYMLEYLERRHLMYIGTDDKYENIDAFLSKIYNDKTPENFNLIELEGDHFSSLKPSMVRFIDEIEKVM